VFTELRVDGFVRAAANAVSGDGTYVTGEGTLQGGYMEAIRWTNQKGASLGSTLAWVAARGVAISDDGTVVVGYIDTRAEQLAFRWDEGGDIVELPPLIRDSGYAQATGVSGDGTIVIGTSPDMGQNQPVQWVGGGVQQLPLLTGHVSATPTGVDYDGNVIVGIGLTEGDYAQEAVRWPANGVFSLGIPRSEVFAVSSDGRYAVGGYVETPMLGPRLRTAFRWSASGVQYLPPALSGTQVDCAAYFISGDGSIVVGWCSSYSGTTSMSVTYLWSEATGIVPVDQVLRELGVDTSLYTSLGVTDISTDGTALIGSCYDDDGLGIGWRAYIDSVFP
jgi:probable HAF family extracellular repeat protein